MKREPEMHLVVTGPNVANLKRLEDWLAECLADWRDNDCGAMRDVTWRHTVVQYKAKRKRVMK